MSLKDKHGWLTNHPWHEEERGFSHVRLHGKSRDALPENHEALSFVGPFPVTKQRQGGGPICPKESERTFLGVAI